MSKRYRPWKIDEPMLLPATVQEYVAKDHLARFVLSLVVDPSSTPPCNRGKFPGRRAAAQISQGRRSRKRFRQPIRNSSILRCAVACPGIGPGYHRRFLSG